MSESIRRLTLGVSGYSHADPRLIGVRSLPRGRTAFPAGWALIQHATRGWILFDCGYGECARSAMQRGLRWMYSKVVGVCCPAHGDASQLLQARGIAPSDVSMVVISHFHPDHVGGLRAFPRARFVAHADAWKVLCAGPFARLHAQVWRELLPDDFEARLDLLHERESFPLRGDLASFGNGHDLLGDESLIVLPLPGHAAGQIGLALHAGGERVLLVADAFWRHEQLDTRRALPRITRSLATHHNADYESTLQTLREFRTAHPHSWIIPAHCAETLDAWRRAHPGDEVLGIEAPLEPAGVNAATRQA